ncbi:MAG: tRNA guanosine(34) transglycosylase Tgt [Polyangiaceae bacterium]|nr:tRNA guanosine(34) transglycosylase Tgt [Polyangiaceae bacterium]
MSVLPTTTLTNSLLNNTLASNTLATTTLPTAGFSFSVQAQDGPARAGVLGTPHGCVLTPTFMPVGTQGSVKSLSPGEVAGTGARIVLGNTYHLWIRPGPEVISELGGLHGFTKWPHVMLTDSGGFQAFSLQGLVKLSEDGFSFRSHVDGSPMHLSPEEAMRVQGMIGADIAMQLDVCPPGDADELTVRAAMDRTSRWADRCLAARRSDQAVFGIVQGGVRVGLRREHARTISGFPFDGLALGGFSVGEPIDKMHEVLMEVGPELDFGRPHYLMGVGTLLDLVMGVGAGVDMFDCVMPTRNARNGQALLRHGRVVIKNAKYRRDSRPIDEGCCCECCSGGYSRAYLRHLYLAGEMLVLRLLSLHNLHVYAQLMADCRRAIVDGVFGAFFRDFVQAGGADDVE